MSPNPLIRFGCLVLVILYIAGCGAKKTTDIRFTHHPHKSQSLLDGYVKTGQKIKGLASWYGQEFAGSKTANGERFNPQELTAAHKSLPFGTLLEVTNPANQKSVVVRINDRGPFVAGRVLDLSLRAAKELGYVSQGYAKVVAEVLAAQFKNPTYPTVTPLTNPFPKRPKDRRNPIQKHLR